MIARRAFMVRSAAMVRRVAQLGWLLLGCACNSPETTADKAPQTSAVASSPAPALSLRVEFSGCSAIWRGPICAPTQKRRLAIWVRADERMDLSVQVDGTARPVAASAVQAGQLFSVPVPEGTRRVAVVARRDGASQRWTLALREDEPLPVLDQVGGLRRAGHYDEALSLLDHARTTASDEGRARIDSMRARLRLARGDGDEGLALLGAAMAAHRAHGRLRDAAWDGLKLARELSKSRGDVGAARRQLASLGGELKQVHVGRAIASYTAGLIARDTGDLRAALDHFDAAIAQAERLGRDRLARDFRQPLATTLAKMGRSADAERQLQQILARVEASQDMRAVVAILDNICWVRIVAREARRSSLGTDPLAHTTADPLPPCKRALELAQQHDKNPEHEMNLWLNLAIAHFQQQQSTQARRYLALLQGAQDRTPLYMKLWMADLEAHMRLQDGKHKVALKAFDALERRARAVSSDTALWRAQVGRGLALEALGRDADAIVAYEAAEVALANQIARVPLGGGRDTFLGDRERSARLLIDLLLRLERPAAAFAAARRSRMRLVASLWVAPRVASLPQQARERWEGAVARYRKTRAALDAAAAEDWKLPADQQTRERTRRREAFEQALAELEQALALPGAVARGEVKLAAAAEGELMLGYHPVRRGWVGFAAHADGVRAERVPAPENHAGQEQLARHWLLPFAVELKRAKALVILPYGPLRSIDFHALPFEGKPLVSHLPVAYRLDLPPAPQPDSPPAQAALLVADPGMDLPAARDESARVGKLMASRGQLTVHSVQGDEATSSRVQSLLEQVRLFHYAGHAHFGEGDTWQSALPLAAGGRLGLGDVLALRRVPSQIVLSGCDTGKSDQRAPIETMGLAHAFLVRGAHWTIATTRPVRDKLAGHMARALYEQMSPQGWADIAAQLRIAQLNVAAQEGHADWASYRAIVR